MVLYSRTDNYDESWLRVEVNFLGCLAPLHVFHHKTPLYNAVVLRVAREEGV